MMGPVAPQPGNGKIQQKSKFERKEGRAEESPSLNRPSFLPITFCLQGSALLCRALENNLNEILPKIDLRADHLMRYLANIVRGCLRRSKTPFAHSHNTGVALASDCLTAFSRVR